MAITRVNVGTLVRADSGNVTPTNPASIAAGDILLLIAASADNVTATLPAGWTKKIEQNASTNCRLTVAWIRYDGAAGNPLVTHTAGSSVWAVIVAYRGCKSSGDPFTDAQAQVNTAITTTITAPTITPLSGDQVIFAAAAGEGGTNNGGVQSLSGWSGANPTLTERGDNSDPGTGSLLCDGGFADGPSTGGATGARTVTMATAGQATTNSVGALLALTQDAGGASFPMSMMLPLTGLAIPGYPSTGPMQSTGVEQNALGYVTPLPMSRFVNPLSLAMGPVIFPIPAPYVIPVFPAGGNQAITPDPINATSSMTGSVVKLALVVPAAITATSTVTSSVVKLARITPAPINATSALSASVKKLVPITPGALTATSTVAATVVKLAVIKATLSATSAMNATVTKPGIASIVPSSVLSTSTIGAAAITVPHGSWIAPTVGTQVGKSIDRGRTR